MEESREGKEETRDKEKSGKEREERQGEKRSRKRRGDRERGTERPTNKICARNRNAGKLQNEYATQRADILLAIFILVF